MTTSFFQCLILSVAAWFGPADDAMTSERLEAMLTNGDHAWIVATFWRYPDQVLPFADGYLEGGLKIIEEGGDVDEATESMRRGLQFAQLASDAFEDTIFEDYAASFGSWSPKEQAIFRRGQRLYREGRTLERDDAASAEAIELFRESHGLAESLGDWWGMAMARGGMTRVFAASGEHQKAVHHGRAAANIYRRLRLESSEVQVLLTTAKSLDALGETRGAIRDVNRAWLVLRGRTNDDRTIPVLEDLIRRFEGIGETSQVESLREELQRLTADAPAG